MQKAAAAGDDIAAQIATGKPPKAAGRNPSAQIALHPHSHKITPTPWGHI
jgi:hypothetical protein